MPTMTRLTTILWALTMAANLVSPVSADERTELDTWLAKAVLHTPPPPSVPTPGLELRRQDHGELSLGRSVLNTPLNIGGKVYEHGLGTHANSEIVVHTVGPAGIFEAQVGVDDNHDTNRQHGSVVFVVEAGGKELFRSALLKGGDAPVPVHVELGPATEFTLRILDGGDNTSWDQADWAAAALAGADQQKTWLDTMKVLKLARWSEELPFSFLYDGKPSKEILTSWRREQKTSPPTADRQIHTITWTDPKTNLVLKQELTRWTNYPAVEWVLTWENRGSVDTAIIETVLGLDLRLLVPGGQTTLHHAYGSTSTATDFLPIDTLLTPNQETTLSPKGGRSSNGALPFFNLAWPGGGLVGAIGWSGQWAAVIKRNAGNELSLRIGQQTTHFRLHPGETVRSPRILLITYQGHDAWRGNNLLRRTMLDHYVPRINGEVALPPVTELSWFTFNEGNDVTEQNQLEYITRLAPGVEHFWLDAGWFEGGWPDGVGSWDPKQPAFPHGLAPLGEAAHKAGKKFVVWFEPERVNPASRIGKEHPEWVLRDGDGDGLFNLGDPAARAWLTDALSKRIADWGIDIFRNDFNIDPLRFWQKADAPDRMGIAEMHYIEGLYTMWDQLCERKPGLLIDNCASGGRRIDLETCSRSLPLWRSDSQGAAQPLPLQDQGQTGGLSRWIPFHAAGLWAFEPYAYRSVATTGVNVCLDTSKDYDRAAAQKLIGETLMLRPLQLGDYYALLDVTLDEQRWCAWQFDRPEQGRGYAMFFRRAESPYTGLTVALKGLETTARYKVTFTDTGRSQSMSGADLQHLPVTIDSIPGSALVMYEKQPK